MNKTATIKLLCFLCLVLTTLVGCNKNDDVPLDQIEKRINDWSIEERKSDVALLSIKHEIPQHITKECLSAYLNNTNLMTGKNNKDTSILVFELSDKNKVPPHKIAAMLIDFSLLSNVRGDVVIEAEEPDSGPDKFNRR